MRSLGDDDALRLEPMLKRREVIDDKRRMGHAGPLDRRIQQHVVRIRRTRTVEDQVDAHAIRAEHFVRFEQRKARALDEAQRLVKGHRPRPVADTNTDVVVGENASGTG